MARASTIENSPIRKQLIDMMVRGESQAKIAKLANISRQAVTQYMARYIKPALKSSHGIESSRKMPEVVKDPLYSSERVALEVQREMLLSRLSKHEPTMDRAIEEAAASKEFSGMASVASARKGHIELEAKLRGLLADATPTTTVNVTVLQPGITPQEQQEPTIEADWSPV